MPNPELLYTSSQSEWLAHYRIALKSVRLRSFDGWRSEYEALFSTDRSDYILPFSVTLSRSAWTRSTRGLHVLAWRMLVEEMRFNFQCEESFTEIDPIPADEYDYEQENEDRGRRRELLNVFGENAIRDIGYLPLFPDRESVILKLTYKRRQNAR